jgi:hypothetical protein
LFVHFDATCKNVTSDVYRDLLGVLVDPRKLQPIDDLLTSET